MLTSISLCEKSHVDKFQGKISRTCPIKGCKFSHLRLRMFQVAVAKNEERHIGGWIIYSANAKLQY